MQRSDYFPTPSNTEQGCKYFRAPAMPEITDEAVLARLQARVRAFSPSRPKVGKGLRIGGLCFWDVPADPVDSNEHVSAPNPKP